MLLGRVCLHLVFRHFQCLNQTFASLSRINDFVNISQLGSLIRSGKLFFVGFQFLGLCCFVSFAEQDIDGAVRTHHSNFCTWVSEVHVSSGLLGVHYDISTTVSFAGNHCQFGNSGFCKCINYFCTVTDDTIVFLCISRKESRNIFECNQWNIEAIAETDKTACFVAGINIENTGKISWLIRYDTYRTTCHTQSQ